MAQVQDANLERVKTCEFDMAGRPMRIREKEGQQVLFSTEASYDAGNRISAQKERIGNVHPRRLYGK